MNPTKFKVLYLLLVAFFAFNHPTFSNPDPGKKARLIFYVFPKTSQSFAVTVANLQEEKTLIQIKNVVGQTWYKETIKGKAGYAKNFDLENLPEGDYFLIVTRGTDKIVQFFSNQDEEIELYAIQRFDEPNQGSTAEIRNDF